MIEVELPDGSIAEFPEGTSREVIQSTLRKQFNMAQPQSVQAQQQASQPQSGVISKTVRDMAGLTGQGLQGFGLNFADEAVGSVGAGMQMALDTARGRDVQPFGQEYNRYRDQARELFKETEDKYPKLAMASNFAGSIPTGTAFVNKASNARQLATGSAALGAAYGFGAGEGTEDRILSAGTGAALGGATGYGTGKIADVVLPSKYTEKVGQALTKARQAAYDAVDSSKAAIGMNSVRSFVDNAETMLKRQGYVPSEHTGIKRALEDLKNTPQKEMTSARVDAFMKRLDTLRDGQEGLAGMFKREVGNFADALTPNQMAYGGAEGANAIKTARRLYAKEMRDKAVDDVFKAVERRGRSVAEQTTFDNEFRKLVNDEMFMAGLPENARKTVERAAEPSMVDRLLYRAAGLSPFSGGRLGVGLGAVAGGSAAATMNPAFLAPQAVGVAADAIQRARQLSMAERARDLVKNMGAEPLTYAERLKLMK